MLAKLPYSLAACVAIGFFADIIKINPKSNDPKKAKFLASLCLMRLIKIGWHMNVTLVLCELISAQIECQEHFLNEEMIDRVFSLARWMSEKIALTIGVFRNCKLSSLENMHWLLEHSHMSAEDC